MALSPKDVCSRVMLMDKASELEKDIDNALKSWKGTSHIRWSVPRGTSPLVIEILIKWYEDAGWTVGYVKDTCAREGPWSYLTFDADLNI